MIALAFKNIKNSFKAYRSIYSLLLISQIVAIMILLLVYGIITSYNIKIEEKYNLGLDPHYNEGIVIVEFGNLNCLEMNRYSIITKINDYKIDSLAEFRRRLYQNGLNKEVKINYYEYQNGYKFVEKEVYVQPKALGY